MKIFNLREDFVIDMVCFSGFIVLMMSTCVYLGPYLDMGHMGDTNWKERGKDQLKFFEFFFILTIRKKVKVRIDKHLLSQKIKVK